MATEEEILREVVDRLSAEVFNENSAEGARRIAGEYIDPDLAHQIAEEHGEHFPPVVALLALAGIPGNDLIIMITGSAYLMGLVTGIRFQQARDRNG